MSAPPMQPGAAEPAFPAQQEQWQEERTRILLVEDDAGDALLVEELLTDTLLPYELHWKQTLRSALDEAGTLAPDCVLADLHLPDSAGLQAVQALKEAYPSVGVIVLTGLAESQTGVQAVASGAQDYLVKGQVDAAQLRRALSYAIERKRAEVAGAELQRNRMRAEENARLERGLLPTPLIRSDSITVATRYLPSRDHALLGGDFLDVVQTPDGTVHAVIGDVSGHGPDEAALGVYLRIAWRTLVLAGHYGIETLDHLEQLVTAERRHGSTFVTCATLKLNPHTGEGVIHLAGHHEPILLNDEPPPPVPAPAPNSATPTALNTATGVGTHTPSAPRHTPLEVTYGTALGIAPGIQNWPATHFTLPAKSALLLYTDGLVEGYTDTNTDANASAAEQRLGVPGLLDLLTQAPDHNPEALLNHIVDTARRMNQGRHADDIAIMYLSCPRKE